MPGRKPTKLKSLQGTARPCRINGAEPDYVSLDDDPPEYLTARERRKWLELCAMLKEAGVMTVADIDALTAYVQVYWIWRDAVDIIKTEGMMIPDEKTGAMVKHPMHQIRRDAQADFVKLMIEFGLTPASRSRVVSSKENKTLKRDGFAGIKR